jgi:transketolase
MAALMKLPVIYLMTHDSIQIGQDGPTAILLTRQGVPVLPVTDGDWREDLRRGARVVRESPATPALVVVATGSDVSTALSAVAKTGRKDVRVISMISRERFLRSASHDLAYRKRITGTGVPILVIEAGVPAGWHELSAPDAPVTAVHDFGVSAPGPAVYQHFGFGEDAIAKRIEEAVCHERSQ